MDFLQLEGKTILVFGVANRKSVAYHVGQILGDVGAHVLYSVRTPQRRESVRKLVAEAPVYVCDVEMQDEIERLRDKVAQEHRQIDGIVHSIAFADYSQRGFPSQAGSGDSFLDRQAIATAAGSSRHRRTAGWQPFHKTPRAAFLQAVDISCFSLIAVASAFAELIDKQQGSVVTVSISTTRMAAENYGYMAPVKAALDSSVCFLAKSFSEFSSIRFNAVCPALLKTSSSAGIPGYVDSYLFAEQATLRKKAIGTDEVANTVAFLLSPRSSGINAQGIVVDAGMSINYFDSRIIAAAGPSKQDGRQEPHAER